MSAPGQIIPLKPLILMSVFAFIVLGFQAALYSEDFTPASPQLSTWNNHWWGSGIPIIGAIIDVLIDVWNWISSVVTFFWNLVTFNIPEIPSIIRGFFIIINVVFLVVIVIFIMELVLKVASIVRG